MDTADANLPVYDSAALKVPVFHELTELVKYRYLLWNLISRDLIARYKRSTLGIFWAMLNPLLTMIVLVIVFSQLFGRVENFHMYLLSGLLLWNLFSQATNFSMASILGSRQFVQKIYVPPSVFVASPVGAALINLLFAIAPLLILAMITGVPPKASWLFLPVPIALTTAYAFGISLIVSALVVFFQDVRDIFDVFLRAYFYLTPIFYPANILPDWLQKLEQFNPMFHMITTFRASLLEGHLPTSQNILLALLWSLSAVAIGWIVFARLTRHFAYRT